MTSDDVARLVLRSSLSYGGARRDDTARWPRVRSTDDPVRQLRPGVRACTHPMAVSALQVQGVVLRGWAAV